MLYLLKFKYIRLFNKRYLLVSFGLLFCFFYLYSPLVVAYSLSKLTPNEDDVLLLDTYLDSKPLISTLDTYLVDGKLLLAVEPLFDNLALRYSRGKNVLRVWKNKQIIDIKLNADVNNEDITGYWADDGFYLYIDKKTLRQLFNIDINYNTERLTLNITTKTFKFPTQKLAKLTKLRQLEQAVSEGDYQKDISGKVISDQYRLFTLPHGSFSFNSTLSSEQKNSLNYSVQTVSDFLYHSTSLTINDANTNEMSGRLNFSRYKTLPDSLIAGAIDRYSFGDINNIADNLTSGTQSGLGFVLSKEPEQFRYRNIGTSITETAIPGWDAELYWNGKFIELKTVPSDGNLIFEDVETQYGNNHYEIKLYGPFGEKEVRTQDLVLDQNALAKGQLAYSVYGLDDKQRLINNQSNKSYSLNNSGVSLSYGISDSWLVGLNYVMKKDLAAQQQNLVTLKNSLSFPGLLFNNEISLQDGAGYAQITSLSGNGFNRDTFNFLYESSDDYQSGRINSAGIKLQHVDLSYSGDLRPWYYTLGANYNDVDGNKNWQLRNFLSRNFFNINFSNNLFYNRNEFENNYNDSISGSFVAAGSISNTLRISAIVDYRPDVSQVVQNASLSLSWRDGLNLYHNLRGTYQLKQSTNKWNVNYNLSWSSEQFQLQLAANYDAQSRWMLTLGVRFFLAYDYYNHKPIFSSQLAANSATINTYSYLDRNPNGWRDEGDWDLQGVNFSGNPAWQHLSSDANGKTVLPGVPTRSPYKFNAQWEYGTKSLINDYVIYTHPGAYIDVNMPFYVTTDFAGFVYKRNYYQQQSPLSGVVVEILNRDDKLINLMTSDVDGYYQFSDMLPGNYKIRVANNYLTQSGYTTDTIGYQLNTPSRGGLVELPALNLQTLPLNERKLAELSKPLNTANLNVETNVWLDGDDPNKGKVYSLNPSGQYRTQKSAIQPDSLPNVPVVRKSLPNEPVTRVKLPVSPVVRTQFSIQPIIRDELPISPITRAQLPITPIVRTKLLQQPIRRSQLPIVIESSLQKKERAAKQVSLIRTPSWQPVVRTELPVKPIVRSRLPITPIVRSVLPVDPQTGELHVNTAQVAKAAIATTTSHNKKVNKNIPKEQTRIEQNSLVNDIPQFTLQLGIFASENAAKKMVSKLVANELKLLREKTFIVKITTTPKEMFRVLLGQFSSHNQAKYFAKNNLPKNISVFVRSLSISDKKDKNASQGYVIQFMAGHNKQQILASAQVFSHVDNIRFAEKSYRNRQWYCLISQVYLSKAAAKEALAVLQVKGWVVSNAIFSHIRAVN